MKFQLAELLESEYLKDFENPEMALAAAKIWDLTLEETQEMEESTGNFGYGKTYTHPYISGEFWVMDFSEVEDAFRAYENNFIDELIVPELENVSSYLVEAFDRENYIRTVKDESGYDVLSSYDGYSHDVNINGNDYVVFRMN